MAAGARVPDLGSDFAQKMLHDLRRRRERLGFSGSPSAAAAAAASRDAGSNSQNPVRGQKPRQAAAAPPSATHRSQQQQPSTSNAVASAAKPRRGRPIAAAAADARAIVPFQVGGAGGGKTEHAVVASGVDVQMAALALALSDGGKLRNMEVVARNGSVFFRQPDTARLGGGGGYLLPPPPPSGGGTGARAGEVAIGVQDLNDMLMAAYSSGGRRRPDDEARKKLFRGSMDMEEALSMLVMLQDASRYMEGSGSGLKGKENRKGSPATRSARIKEIVDEDSDAEHAKNASMQMVVHNKFQSHQTDQSTGRSSVMESGPSISNIKSASEGEKDGSKVRMPSVIAKLMGLENLPSSTTTTAAERKGTERFVKPGAAVPRMEVRGNAMDRKLPIRIIASEKGQHKIVLAGEWKNGLTNFGESEIGAAALSNSSSHPAPGNNSRQGRLTMREVLRKMVAAERGADEKQVADERIIHEDKTAAEEIKLQNSVSVGCRADSGKRMDFLKRFRKNSDNRPVKEEKHTAQVKSAEVGKKQATGMRRLLGRDGEGKSRRAREKVNKENLASAETKAAGKNGKTDQVKHQAQSKHVDRQSKLRKPQNRREMQSETPSRKLENKKSLMPEAGHMKKKPEYTVVTQQENEERAKEHVSFSKPADSTHGEGGLSEPLAIVVRGNSTTGAASLDQPLQKITQGSSEKATETPREPQNRRETHSKAPNWKLENKKALLSEAGHMRKKLECTVVAQQENEVDAKINDTISSNKPADSTHVEGGLSKPLTMVVRDSTTAEAIPLDQPLQKITEGISDPTIPAETVVHASEDLKFLDQSAIAEINDERMNHTPSETTQIPEIFTEEERQQEEEQQQQQMIVKEQLTEDLKFLDQSMIPETNDEWINHTPSEATQIPETFAEEEQQQQQQQQEQQTVVIPEAFTKEEEEQQQMIVKEQLTDGSDDHTTTSVSSENLQETHVVTCDSLTENQLMLMRLLVKDRYLLETAKAIVRVDAPVSFMDDVAGAPSWSDKGNDLLSDVAREVIRRKGKRSEAMEEVSVARTANLRLRYLDDLVRELDGDVESLDMSKSKRTQQQGDNRAAENLRRILESDIQNDHPDANSTWDFGWNRVWELPLEKGDVVRDLEKNILGGIITDVARDLIRVSVRHGCCPCVA
ncbi:unnamed protein product [Triticum turgidum subsp. durum]|uniref:DUF3741 domain-containing protein n=1 Tax=Triticum turgidum subsp. durum TaxID=4567 RepID=A0A9R1AR99_TRITD|nr:unnamed protein product [Triticum turgidum subsp. durum]